MCLQMVSCEELYTKFPHLDRNVVLELQEWLNAQPHLPTVSECEVIVFLEAWDGDAEMAKKRLDMHYTERTHCPEFFANRNVFGADITSIMKVLGIVLLPELTEQGSHVIFCKFIDAQPSKFDCIGSIKFWYMVLDLLIAKYGVTKLNIVFDMNGVTFTHLTKMNISALKKFVHVLQETVPIQLQSFYFINIPSFMDRLLSILRPFIRSELLNSIHTHKSLESFLEKSDLQPKTMLPDEYSGRAGKLYDIMEKMNKEIQAYDKFFIDEEATKRVNEKLRNDSSKTRR